MLIDEVHIGIANVRLICFGKFILFIRWIIVYVVNVIIVLTSVVALIQFGMTRFHVLVQDIWIVVNITAHDAIERQIGFEALWIGCSTLLSHRWTMQNIFIICIECRCRRNLYFHFYSESTLTRWESRNNLMKSNSTSGKLKKKKNTAMKLNIKIWVTLNYYFGTKTTHAHAHCFQMALLFDLLVIFDKQEHIIV